MVGGVQIKFSTELMQSLSFRMDIKITFLLLLVLLAHSQEQVKTPLSILYVSSDPGTIVRPVYSSLRGGRMIYIKATGHSPDPSDNLVYVGTFPCIVPSDGVTDTFISCETGDTGSTLDINNLPVTLISYGTAVTSSYPNSVYYRDQGYTPQLRDVFPSAGFAGRSVNLYGIHRISDLGDGLRFMGNVTRIRLGEDMCSRFDVQQDAITLNDYNYVRCLESSVQEAGKYNVSEQVTPGFAKNNILMRRSSFDPHEYFEFTSLPTVGSVAPANGNIGGQYLTISGTGFSLNPANNSVTVDGNDCKVTSASSDQLKCTVANKDPAKSSLLSTNASSQVSGYFSGAGLTYARYPLSTAIDTMAEFVPAVRGSNTSALGTPSQTGFRADLREGDVYSGDYAQTWTGYFTAPVTGTYTFRGAADDYFALYLNADYGSKASPASPLIYSNTYTTMFRFYENYVETAVAKVQMEAGKSYYLECYQIDTGGNGFIDVSVEVPNSDASASFLAYQIDQITTNSTIQPEIKVFTMTATTGTLELRVVRQDPTTFAVTYDKKVNVTFGSTASTFESALSNFDGYNNMGLTVVRKCYDANNTLLPDATGAVKIEYETSIQKLRSSALLAEQFTYTKFNGYVGSFSEARTQTHSPLISGTFTLTIGGADILISGSANLPFNVAASSLQTAIRAAAAELQKVEVTSTDSSDCGYSCTWIIKYKGVPSSISLPTVSGASLSGGSTTPTVAASNRRPFSTNIEFDPIDYRFLHTSASAINVLVATNGIPAICTGNCAYTFNTYTQITTLSYSGTTLTLALSDPTTQNFAINTISVTVEGKPCTINGGSSLTSLTCAMSTNTDGTPILVAGSETPVVSVGTFGIAGLASSVSPLAVSLVATSLSVTTGGNNGGYLISLNGKGFPLDKKEINITLCSNKATIKAISNIKVDFYVPACSTTGSQTLNLQMGATTDASLSFTYTNGSSSAPTITALSPASANPGIKGMLEISGSGFGIDPSLVKVFLSNATGKVYQLNIFNLNNTYIKTGLPGGLPGVFTVEVNLASSVGDSIAASPGVNTFTYAFSVSSISPSTGSIYGGTLLTITGENFSTDRQNTLVYIGDTLNWFCTIESITTTEIKCRTPAISRFYSVGSPVSVVVSTRLLILNQCTGTCQFTYVDAASSPALTSASSTSFSVAGSSTKTITLTGTNLLDSNSQAQVALTNTISQQTTVFTAGSLSATSVTFTVTSSLPSGNYQAVVRNAVGASNALSIAVGWSPGTASWNQGGSVKGGIISVSNGGGYPTSIDGKAFSITLTANSVIYPVTIVSCCTSNTVTLEIPAAPTGTAFTLTFTGPTGSSTKTYSILDSLTPTASITTAMPLAVGANTISFSATNSLTVTISSIKLVSTIDKTKVIQVSAGHWTTNGTGASAVTTFDATLYTGSYNVLANTQNGFISISQVVNVAFPTNVVVSPQQMSFNGGSFTVQANYISPASYITLNGLKGNIIASSNSEVTYEVPALLTATTKSILNPTVTLLDNTKFGKISDTDPATSKVSFAFDGLTTTNYGSTNAQCYLGVDAGSSLKVSANRFRFFPDLSWTNVGKMILQAQFQGSDDLSAWTTLATVDQTVHSGWNVIKSTSDTAYRYLRFKHNSTSNCSIAEFQVFGILYSTASVTLASTTTDVILVDGFNTKTFTGYVDYQNVKTPTVNTVSPRFGDAAGGYTLTLTGTNLDAGTPSISIDGVNCPVASSTATTIVCNVAARTTTPTIDNTFVVKIGPSTAILKDIFYYVLKWSSASTWGVDTPPVDNDLVYVPKGLTLYVDQDTPILEGIAVEGGRLVFSDESDIKVQAGHITMNGGHFIAGTEAHPHTHKLEFVLYGGYYGKQMPMFGNKGIGCMNCKFEMYGTPRPVTWSRLTATANVGASQITVADTVDWAVGEEIVIASTSFEHTEAEVRRISAISGSTITLNQTLNYKHVSVVEDYGGDKLAMQAEVGLLTRNIKMHGESESEMKQYGSHLMLTGSVVDGFSGYVGYTEFYHCGQPQILGRYCIHFHMVGDIPDSYARGNAVHDSFARLITIHGVHHLTVENNVGYRIKGHNVFVEDGIETHNLIKHNLVIGSLQTTRMLQTDTSVASFWITNPTNDFVDNVAAGSDFYGIWYELKEHPDGPSATIDVCPMGNPLGTVTNNVAHSNIRFGLRIFILASRMYPCDPVRNNTDPNDPWSYNPSQASVFQNFTIYKSKEDGVLSEETGNVFFDRFIIAESFHAGVEFYIANMTKEAPGLTNSVIIGMSVNNAHSDTTNYTNGMAAAITGRTGTYKLSNIKVYNFPAGSIFLQTCRFCDNLLKYTNLGTEVLLDQLTFSNFSGKYLFMIGLKRDIVRDLDGSLSQAFDGQTRASGTVVHGFPHIAAYNNADCPPASTTTDWDDAVMCAPALKLRRAWITNLIDKQLFNAQLMKVVQLNSINDTVDPNTTLAASQYTSITSRLIQTNNMEPKVQLPYSYSLPYILGRIYNIWWGTGIEFSHLAIVTDSQYLDTEPAIIFKFNYTENRELFEVGPMRGGVKKLTSLDFLPESTAPLDPSTCTNGQFFHNNDQGLQRMVEVCASGKNRTKFEYTEVNGIVCRFNCPLPTGVYVLQDFVRFWSNATQWPNGVLPAAGDNVTVNGTWRLLLDINPPPMNYFIIDGHLMVDDTRDINITANSIHIRAGNLSAGSASSPFLHKFTIQVNGAKTDNGFYVDPIVAGNKYLVVTGILNLYGPVPDSINTYLTAPAAAGSSTIKVASSAGWKAGDQLVISPSFRTYNQYEKVTISSLNADGTITLSAPLAYTHYGDGSITISNSIGQLDTRARVGHISRSVKVVPGPDSGWGFSVIVYGYLDGTILRVGSTELSGVLLQSGGQLDTLNAPLKFLNSKNGNFSSKVTATAFVNCKASCIYVENSEKISMTNNVLFNAWNYAVQMTQITQVVFNYNTIIGVQSSPSLPEGAALVACMFIEEYLNPASQSTVKENFCIGSSQHGFAFPHTKCTELETNPMAKNTAGSTRIGFIFNTIGEQCQGFSYARAYANQIGQICGPPGIQTIVFDHFVMADNGRSVTLKVGANEGGSNHTAYLHNSYITAISRPSCDFCYGPTATICSNTIGVRMLTASANGQVMPAKYGSGFDVVCKQPVFDSKSYIVNTTFDSFRQSYSTQPNCNSNFMFTPNHGGFDQVASANLFACPATNSDTSSYLIAPQPSTSFLGWFGGCGDIVCTGFQNYLVQDHTSDTFGFTGTIIPNNSVIAVPEGCVFNPSMNSYMCQNRSDFAVLQYQNVAADFKTRIMWPVKLTGDGLSYTTVTNGWREWEWLGSEPLNRRFGRFVSIIRTGQNYNMTFLSEPPQKLQVMIQRRTIPGSLSSSTFRLHYPKPNSIRLKLGDTIVDPILLTDVNNTASAPKRPLNTSECGSHIYFYTNYTISFVVTEEPNCLVQIELTESVQLTTHFSMDINDFFNSNSAITNFINNLCALLNIVDTSRVKVVGVLSGSVQVIVSITPSSSPNSTEPTIPAISAGLTSSIASGGYSVAMGGIGLGSVIGASSVYYTLGEETTESSSSTNVGLIAGVAVAGVVLLVGVVVTVVCCVRRRAKVVEEVMSHEDEVVGEKEVGKESHFMFGSSEGAGEVANESEIKIKNNTNKASTVLKVHELGDNSEIIDN